MRMRDYIFSKGSSMCIALIGVIVFGVFLLFIGAKSGIIVLGIFLYLVIYISYFTVGFVTARNRIRKLQERVNELDKKYLAGELIDRPVDAVEAEYYYIMKAISRSAIGLIEEDEKDRNEYFDYVENWVHEMKTPLTACSLILDNDCDKRKLRKELKRADNLMDTILYYARLRTVDRDIKIRKISLSEAVNEAVKQEMELLISAHVSVSVSGEGIINSDDKIIGFIIRQFLVNTAKYCNDCKVKIEINYSGIIYEDNGIGIPSYELDRIRERGFTGTNGRKLGNSTGMGLFIVGRLCDNMDIDWITESIEGSYTRHTLAFSNLTKV